MPYPTTKAVYLASGATRRREKLIFHAQGCQYVPLLKKPTRGYLTRQEAIQDSGRACLRCKP